MEIEIRAVHKHLRMSPSKVRLLAPLVVGQPVERALGILKMSKKAAALPVAKALKSAAANAETNYGLSRDDLYVTTVVADEGPTRKWRKAGARGRIKPILRRSTHLTVGVIEKTGTKSARS
jgi:large subunit ribosomal protein L22